MSWLTSILPCKGAVYGGTALLLGLVPHPWLWTAHAEEPPRRLTERIADFSTADVLLSRKAKDALQKDEQLASSQIVVTVKNKVATLKGNATSVEQAKRAVAALRDVPGIASVINECILAAATDTAPEEVAAAMKRAQGQPPAQPAEPVPNPSALTARRTGSRRPFL